MNERIPEEIVFAALPGKGGNIGHILLNRPKALNALTKEMCQALRGQLKQWQKDKHIKAVIIQGEGERAFCAGGDIRSLYYEGKDNPQAALDFFRHEYRMNASIYHFDKPYISFLDGITMGGGAGVSMHGSHRVATERLLYAMPETGIGFFPDIGAGYFLSRMTERIGHYLGLTGERISAGDAYHFGMVTHLIHSAEQAEVIRAITESSFTAQDNDIVSDIIDQFTITMPPAELVEHHRVIANSFDGKSVEEIIIKLQAIHSEWALTTLEKLKSKSPTSLKVTFEQLRRAVNMSFDDIMNMELNIAAQFLKTPDFYEGVRAAIIDKDQSPQWRPDRLEQVTEDKVQTYFLGKENLALD